MRAILLAAGSAWILPACILYDNDPGVCPGCGRGEAGYHGPEDSGTVTTPSPAPLLVFTPPTAEQGETFIGSLRTGSGSFDFGAVVTVEVFGDAEVLVWDGRPDELVLTVAVAVAGSGPVDLLVTSTDGTAQFVDAAFEVFPEGSGHAAGSWGGSTGTTSGGSEPCP